MEIFNFKEERMKALKKLAVALPAIAMVLLLAMVLNTACDNRNPVDSSKTGSSKVSNIAVAFDPEEVIVNKPNVIANIGISIQVSDQQGRGLDSLENSISITAIPNVGIIGEVETTSTIGLYSSTYHTAPGFTGHVNFIVTVAGIAIQDSIQVIYQPVGVASEISMNITPSPLVVHSPYKSDTALIDLWVRDENGAGLDSIVVVVNRTPNLGTIIQGGMTVNGYAQAMYITDPGSPTSVFIRATAGGATILDTLTVFAQFGGEIGHMSVVLQKQSLVAGGSDSTSILVSVTDTTNSPISDNTTIFLSATGSTPHHGVISPSSAPTTGGVATFAITSPATLDSALVVELDSLRAWGISISGETSYASSFVYYIPGSPASLTIINAPVPMVAGSGTAQAIPTRVLDANGNSVINGTQVQFVKTLPLSNITSLTITNHGIATGVYTVGTASGIDIIKAFIPRPASNDTLWSGPVPLIVRSSLASNITINASNPTIQIGGIATQIIATLRDENGNALSDGYPVRFEITASPSFSGPYGPSFLHVPTADSITLVVVDSTDVNGQSSVSLFSGTRAGTVKIKTTSLDNINVFKEKTVVVITSGPPARVMISPISNVQPVGEVLVGGVTAMVIDSFTNPVEYNTAVHFEVIPDSVAMVGGDAFTGGYVYHPDSDYVETIGVPGLAFGEITYTCNRTFDTIRVMAQSGAMVDTSEALILKIYETGARCAVTANPASIFLSSTTAWDTSDISCQLLDGIGCAVANGIIIFSAQEAGEICGQTVDTTNIAGWAYTKYRIRGDMIPQSPPDPPQVAAKVQAVLQGYPNIKGEATITCRRAAL
jgi:hypothetical protein